jgi:WD40 repeat protein
VLLGLLIHHFLSTPSPDLPVAPQREAIASRARISKKGNLLAGGSSRGGVILWDLSNQKEVGRWEGMSGSVDMLAFSPDYQRLAAVVGNQLLVWDIASLQQPKRIIEPGLVFRSLAFDADGKLLATGGELVLWRTDSWQKSSDLQGRQPADFVSGVLAR